MSAVRLELRRDSFGRLVLTDAQGHEHIGVVAVRAFPIAAPGEGVSLLDSISDQAALPPWMSETHFTEYVAAFAGSGFKGPLDWYRCLDRNWTLTAFLQGQKIAQPSLFLVGDRDPVQLADAVLGPLMGDPTRQAIRRAGSREEALALLVMSPEFLRR